MKKMSLDEMRIIQISLLKDFNQICKKHNLRYCLCGGTLLGAIRHKGYIPWDDDIDILMPRPDYNKFINLSDNELKKDISIYCSERISKRNPFLYSYAKLVDNRTVLIEFPKTKRIKGKIYIDIFPLDAAPDNPAEHKKIYRKVHKFVYINYILESSVYAKKDTSSKLYLRIIWNVIFLFRELLPKRIFLKYAVSIVERIDFETCNYFGAFVCGYGEKERYERQIFKITYGEFEKSLYPIMQGYDKYLSILYGDYMKIPPANQRITHDNEAYLLE